MSSEVIDVEATPEPQQAPAQQAQPQAEQLQTAINNEMRFCEETIVRAFRSCVINVVNLIQQPK